MDIVAGFVSVERALGSKQDRENRVRGVSYRHDIASDARREVRERLCEADLAEHLVAGGGALLRGVEDDMSLLFGIFVVLGYRTSWFQGRIIDSQVQEIRRDPAHEGRIQQGSTSRSA